MRRPALVSLLTILLLGIASARPQSVTPSPGSPDPHNFDASAFGQRIDISSAWLFSPSDSPAYASPTFDDRAWITISTRKDFATYGFHNSPICWYRLHIHLPPAAQNVVFALAGVSGEYQAFANGIQIAGPATVASTLELFKVSTVNYRIPGRALEKTTGDLVLAIRFAPASSFGRATNPMQDARAYLVSSDAAPRDASYAATHDVLDAIFLTCLCSLAGCVALALYLAMRTHREYLAAAISLFLYAVLGTLVLRVLLVATNWTDKLLLSLGTAVLAVSLVEFVRLVLLMPRSRLLFAAEVAIFLGITSSLLSYVTPKMGAVLASLPLWTAICLDVLILTLLTRAFRRRNPDAFVLLPLFSIAFIADFWYMADFEFSRLSRPLPLPPLPSLHIASYTFTFHDLSDIAFAIMLLLFLVLRAVRIARERAHAAAEIQAAQTTQQLLLDRSFQPTPGFDIQSVYLPASEVGGDFFLVSPDPNDASLIAILGDVSGKGLPAAMRVAMILGILRREDSRDPATILFRLNNALLAQTPDQIQTGFTTACCIRLRADGAFTIANAGHISPYLNGVELQTDPGLPLGLAPGQHYHELLGQLNPGSRLVLMSDGVVEARNKTGELYGFDRLNALTLQPAQQIADTAQTFGQDDDITVLTLALT